MNIILYSTGCPKCSILKKKLENKGIHYSIYTNEEEMMNMGIREVPILSVDEEMLTFSKAIEWINNYEG